MGDKAQKAVDLLQQIFDSVKQRPLQNLARARQFVRQASSLARGSGRRIRRQMRHGGRGARKLLNQIIPSVAASTAPREIPAAAPATAPIPTPPLPANAIPVPAHPKVKRLAPAKTSKPHAKIKPPKQPALPVHTAKRPRQPRRLKQREASFLRRQQHGPKPIPVAKPVRLQQRQAAFQQRMQHGIPIAKPLPVAKPVRLKQLEAGFNRRMQHSGFPRRQPVPSNAEYRRLRVKRPKRIAADFQQQLRQGREEAKAADFASLFRPRKTGNALASNGGDGSLREIAELLRRLISLAEAQANEGKQRDTGQLPPKEESASSDDHPVARMVHAGVAGLGGQDPIGNAVKAAAKEAMRQAVRIGIERLMPVG